jgi:hypothetical protein
MSTVALPVDTVLHYNDGPDFPSTPLLEQAERAYRDGFRHVASAAASWKHPPEDLRESLWRARREVRRRHEVLVPSSELFGRPEMDSEQIVYRAGHEVEASRARGKVQACELALQCWEALAEQGIPDEAIGPLVLKPWSEQVQAWAERPIDPARISPPPSPMECIPDEHRPLLDQLQAAWEADEPADGNLTPALPAKSVRQLLNEHPSLRRPVIHGLLREGETMNVIASPKIGKSWLVLDLALAVATGRPWLETFECVAGDVLIIDNELHWETTAHRIPKVMNARGIPLDVVGERVFVASVRGGLKDIFGLATCFQHLKPGRFKLIVLDAFYRFMPQDMDENDNGTMAQLYNHLDGYAARLGCSFVLVHHSTKGSQSGKSVTDVGAGAGAQSRATDTHLILRPHEEPDCVVLDAAMRSWPPIEPRVLRWTFPIWTPVDSLDPTALRTERPRRRAKAPEPAWDAARFVAAFVSETPAPMVAIVRVATSAGLSERMAGRLLKQAESQAMIHRWRFGANQPVRFATVAQPRPPG